MRYLTPTGSSHRCNVPQAINAELELLASMAEMSTPAKLFQQMKATPEKMKQVLNTEKGLQTKIITTIVVSFVLGILLPAYAYFVYAEHGDRPCAKPVAGWLLTFALLGLIYIVLGLIKLCSELLCISMYLCIHPLCMDERQCVRSIHSCIIIPLGIFNMVWWIKGNFDVSALGPVPA
jgi:uncharacterized membrane-anchored protein